MNECPLVSVVVTTYNLGWCIEQTLESVFSQTYPNFEVIVVDDASTDDTAARLAAFQDRLTFIRLDRNYGMRTGGDGGVARNAAIRRARGAFVAFLDGDDFWDPDKLAVQVAAAQQYPASGLIAVDGTRFDHESGRIINGTCFGDPYDALAEGSVVTANVYRRLLGSCMIETPSQVMVPARVFETVGLFDDIFASDYDFYVRVAARYDMTFIKKPLMRYRYRTASVSGPLGQQHFRYLPADIEILKKHLRIARDEHQPVIRSWITYKLDWIAHQAFSEGRFGNRLWAIRYLGRLAAANIRSEKIPSILLLIARLVCPRWLSRMARPVTRLLRSAL